METITSSDDFDPNTNVIWDLLRVEFSTITIDLLRELREVRGVYADKRLGSRVAVIVPGTMEKSLISLASDVFELPDGHIKLVHTYADAEAWCLSK